MREIYKNKLPSSKRLLLHPFPQNIKDPIEKEKLWTNYRTDMCKESGIEIILYGYKYKNKCDPKQGIKNSPGVKEEFQLGKDHDLFIIPIGITKYAAEEIWNEMKNDLEKFGYNTTSLRNAFEQLNTEIDNSELIKIIINILNEVKQMK